jgi:GNAT superfamily N-acetyltransferase
MEYGSDNPFEALRAGTSRAPAGCLETSGFLFCFWPRSLHTFAPVNDSAENQSRDLWPLRLAEPADIPAIEKLIPLSARGLQRDCYSSQQIEAALGTVFGVDRQLISDGTYFVVEDQGSSRRREEAEGPIRPPPYVGGYGKLIGCGGWSRRQSLFGSDQGRGIEPELDPARDAARVRAFFVHPQWARQGIGRSLIIACEQAIIQARFKKVELVATLPGEPLYRALDYVDIERFEIPLAGGLMLPVVRMIKTL